MKSAQQQAMARDPLDHQQGRAPSARIVQFGDNLTVHVRTFDQGDASTEDLWFSEQEYIEIKSKSRNDAREWRRQGFSVLLKDVFAHTATEAQDYITTFVQLDGHLHRRGLERYCCRQHGEGRSAAKERARDAVFITQYRAQQEALKDGAAMAELIAAAYANECREAKIFARRLGKADELVALEVPTDKCMMESMLGACRRSVPRRMSNMSVQSNNSVDSRHVTYAANARHNKAPGSPAKLKSSASIGAAAELCPKSPDSTIEELYAAIA